ncbi:thioesterase [Rhodococcus oryzae]|uniref:Thioesterase TesA n=1 Tax=Rhodococcus oryzae TaxID=2571143 RepID=A0ABY2RNT3_9NOCA|nr:alpha/beta fold hydrolase [Rhodococcus oryzae]TJZ80132.1 thioesterase [Rhodococcus oryzae]
METAPLTPYLEDGVGSDTALRMFCFHHAGGESSMYRAWHRALGPHVTVVPVHLPGRGRRAEHERFVDLDLLLDDLEHHLAEHLSGPYVFFGHSMGALVAYRLARRRDAGGHRRPEALLLSAYAAPHLPAPLPPIDHLDDALLARFLTAIGGLPAEILGWPAWLEAALPVIRDDVRMCADHRDPGEAPLACPMHLFGADADPLVGELDLRAWSRHTTHPTDPQILEGDHFYLDESPDELFRLLRPLLRGYARAASADRKE